MKNLQNLHTHSTYCDGKDTPEEMIECALKKGFSAIGFSGHSCMPYSEMPEIAMSIPETEEYKKEIKVLKKKYAGKIDIFLGLEFDMYSNTELLGYDYLIGSLHYLKIDNDYAGFDRNAEIVKQIIDKYFKGDGIGFCREYYRQLAELPKYGKFDILGHIDIITKNCEKTSLFDMESKKYLDAAFEAIDSLSGKIPLFEVNTGAITRGYRTTPYPTKSLLKELKRKGFGAVITSDCHDAHYLDCGFEDARKLLAECGFSEKYILTNNGFVAVEL